MAGLALGTPPVLAQTYIIDPMHTFPSFEADHFGASFWRGKFNKSSGKVVLDRVAKTGTIEIEIDTASVDFGYDKMNEHAREADLLDVVKYPTATYKSTVIKFKGRQPVSIEGNLTLHGVTRPVRLRLNRFKCFTHPVFKKEACGADASAVIRRNEFGINYALDFGFSPEVKLAIQVEALRAD
ncbi:MAG: YceI family protein [Burkholderiaceae bacterium]|nr:YceI family protein [Burkholderiaceae bacterium]